MRRESHIGVWLCLVDPIEALPLGDQVPEFVVQDAVLGVMCHVALRRHGTSHDVASAVHRMIARTPYTDLLRCVACAQGAC